MWTNSCNHRLGRLTGMILTIAAALLFAVAPVVAEVKIDMPAPKKPVRATIAVAATPGAPPAQTTVDAGDLALHRYSNARWGPYDTYFSFPYRNYNYNYDNYGYNYWWGGWPIWGFPFFGNCGGSGSHGNGMHGMHGGHGMGGMGGHK